MIRRSDRILAAAWLVLCLAVVAGAMVIRLSPIERELVLPGWLDPNLGRSGTVLAALSVALLTLAAGHARGKRLETPLAGLIMFYPLLFAYIWLVMPASNPRPGDYAVGLVFLLAAVWLTWKSPPLSHRRFRSVRTWPLDLVLVLVPVVAGLMLGHQPDIRASGFSALLYPGYALIQLAVFLVIPAARLRRFGLSRRATALVCALVFGLVHAPNPVVMPVTAAAMFWWCRQYLNGRKLWQLALVMGLCATTFTQFLPDELTGHMRVGPGYTQQVAVAAMADRAAENGQLETRDFMAWAYPLTLGRQATDEELIRWQDTVDLARRTTMAWQFFTSEEYHQKAAQQGWVPGPNEAVHWVRYDEVWQQKVRAFGSPEYWAKSGKTWPGFTKSLYRDILRRPAGPGEMGQWSTALTQGQRQRLAAVLLDQGKNWHSREFPGLTSEELRLPR